MVKHNLHYTEFYITNVCNLACDNCNRFNNFAFSGHDRWADWADQYRAWSQKLNLIGIGILGGEPLLNPDFMNWMHGIAQLWPTSYINIISNGTQIHRWPTLYQELVRYQGQIKFSVTEHASDRYDETKQKLLSFMQEPTTNFAVYDDFLWRLRYQQLRKPNWPDCRTVQGFLNLSKDLRCQIGLDPDEFYQHTNTEQDNWQDRNGVRITLGIMSNFYPSAIKYEHATNTLHLRNSKPEDAISVCGFRQCHHFIKGRLYKCGPVGILPEFVQQFAVEITDQERKLLLSYRPAQYDWSQEDLDQFIKNLKDADPIEQCRFCPDAKAKRSEGGPTKAYQKKIPIKTLQKADR